MCFSGPRMAHSGVVPTVDPSSQDSSSEASTLRLSTETPSSTSNYISTSQEHVSTYLSTVQHQLEGLGFTERSIKVNNASWREGTTAQY